MDFGGYRSELRNDFILFSQYGLRSEYYHPFTPLTHWFVAPRGLADNDPFYLFANNKLVSIYRQTNVGGGIDVGYQFGRIRRTARRLRRRVEALRCRKSETRTSCQPSPAPTATAEFNTS